MRLCILLVEDNPLNLELHRDLLEMDGHEVIVSESALQFRDRINDGVVPDIVLMDILLPDGDGIDLLYELRLRPALKELPVLAVTAQALAGDVPRLLLAGFDAVITKPIDTRTFTAEVAHWAGAKPTAVASKEGGE